MVSQTAVHKRVRLDTRRIFLYTSFQHEITMSAVTNIEIYEKEEAPESLLAFTFDASGCPQVIDECKSRKDAFALLAFARELIERKLRELSDDAIKHGQNVA